MELIYSATEDPNNSFNTRTQENTDDINYNCGGFALNTFTWVEPYVSDNEDDDDDIYDQYNRDDYMAELIYDQQLSEVQAANAVCEADVCNLLDTYDFLKKINYDDIDRLPPSTRIIAYRLYVKANPDSDDEGNYIDSDFHFKVRIDGKWYEKTGVCPIKECELIPNDFWIYPEVDGGARSYNSEIVYFIEK